MAGNHVRLSSADGFEFGVYQALPDGQPKGAILVIQELFGVNSHIRSVADRYAGHGYAAYAPQLFDRVEPDLELGYGPDDAKRGIEVARGKLSVNDAIADIQACQQAAAAHGKVGLVGYCYGGMLAWRSAALVEGLACTVAYYGGGIAGQLDLQPKCPVLMHFGERDAHIPLADVEKIRAAHPAVEVHVYPADHGFNCDQRGSYDATSAALALERTLAFFGRHL
jgi:carboxymethylenebutenolidase